MLRLVYRWVLCAHPPYFRQRFADEMLSIFDHAETTGTEVGLLVDAVLSLARQWSLRPQFWEKPALAAAADGVPLFDSLSSPMPRTSALVYGAFLSALVLNGIGMTMGYAWNHPTLIAVRQPVIIPPASWGMRSMPSPETSLEPPLYTDQGRVLLVFNAPAHGASQAAADSKKSTPEQAAPKVDPPPPSGAVQQQKGMVF